VNPSIREQLVSDCSRQFGAYGMGVGDAIKMMSKPQHN
jgi:hypothetical protein